MGSINLPVRRVPIGTHQSAADNHRTAPSACTVLFISHPFGVIDRSHIHNTVLFTPHPFGVIDRSYI